MDCVSSPSQMDCESKKNAFYSHFYVTFSTGKKFSNMQSIICKIIKLLQKKEAIRSHICLQWQVSKINYNESWFLHTEIPELESRRQFSSRSSPYPSAWITDVLGQVKPQICLVQNDFISFSILITRHKKEYTIIWLARLGKGLSLLEFRLVFHRHLIGTYQCTLFSLELTTQRQRSISMLKHIQYKAWKSG